tara:strand:- start:44358 stop:45662 length:1305 start_codon:yes stop_codon:yes gene_type:complete
MNVVIIGSGYVGLVSGACFAEFGANVRCVDNDSEKIKKLKNGIIPIYEPGLQELVNRNLQNDCLSFHENLKDVISDADLVFIAVGTPTRRGDGHADLKYVYEVAEEIAKLIHSHIVVVNKSTVPIGTARKVKEIITKINPTANIEVASNPEFLREGSAIEDFMRPDRVVLGVEGENSEKLLKELYRPLNLIETPMITTNLETAELIKYASNAFLATKISFINELSLLAEKTGADIHDVAKGMGLDKRIGNKFLHVGPGYGGSCFPKDTLALIRMAEEHEATSEIIKSVVNVNNSQKLRMIDKIKNALGGSVSGKRLAILGLTFKPETDDMRDAPSLSIIPNLIEQKASLIAHDPVGIEEAKKVLPSDLEFSNSIDEAIRDADAIVILTEWNQYRGLDLERIKEIMKGNTFIDLRNVYEKATMIKQGFNYHCIGR